MSIESGSQQHPVKEGLNAAITGVDNLEGYSSKPLLFQSMVIGSGINGFLHELTMRTGILSSSEIDLASRLAEAVVLWPSAVFLALSFYEDYEHRKKLLKGNELGYHEELFRYRGEDITGDNKESIIRKNDTLKYVNLPRVKGHSTFATLNPAQVLAYRDLVNQIGVEIKNKIARTSGNIAAVCFESSYGDNFLPSEIRQGLKTTRKKLFANKTRKVKGGETEVRVLSRNKMQEFGVEVVEDEIDLAQQALGDDQVTQIATLLKGPLSYDEEETAEGMLEARLTALIQRDIDSYFNGPEIHFNRGEDYLPIRQKRYPIKKLKRKSDGEYCVVVTQGTSNTEIPLADLFKIDGLSVQDIVLENRSHKKGQLAYWLLKKSENPDFYRPDDLKAASREQVLSQMSKVGLELEDVKKLNRVRGSWLQQPAKTYGLTTAVLMALLTLTYAGTISIDKIKVPALPVLSQVAQMFKPQYQVPVSLPTEVPKHQLDWQVRGLNGADTKGYYITSISDSMFDDKPVWIANSAGGSTNVLYPPILPSAKITLPTILLEKRVSTKTSQKISLPVKNGDSLTGIDVFGSAGQRLPHEAKRYHDNTVELELNQLSETPWADIRISMSEDLAGSPRAVDYGALKVDATKFNPRLSNFVDILQGFRVGKNDLIGDYIKNNHMYSINPKDRDLLDKVKTKEDLVNTIDKMKTCDCLTCNSLSVLISQIVGPADLRLGLASGYLHNVNNPVASGGSFLLAESSHAFGIDQKGGIVDVTPTRVAEDEMTNQFVKSLKSGATVSDRDQQDWAESQLKIAKEVEFEGRLIKGLITGAEVLLLSALGTIAALKGRKFLVTKARDLLFPTPEEKRARWLKRYSKEDLTLAYDYYSWLSWGGDQPFGRISKARDLGTAEQILTKLETEVDLQAVDRNLSHADERSRQLYSLDASSQRMRVIGKYLRSVR